MKTLTGGAFQDSHGTVVANGIITLTLSQAAVVSGTNQVVPTLVQFTLDSSGNMPAAATVWGNDELSPAGTSYTVLVYNSSTQVVYGPITWVIQGVSPINVATLIPASSSVSYAGAVLLVPASDQTIATNNLLPGTDLTQSLGSGSKRWNASLGVTTTEALNSVRFADQYSGADASVKINAAIADVIAAGGGTCDARGLLGSQTISQQINVGNSSQVPVCLRLPHSGTWTVTITDGVSSAFKMFSGSSLIGTSPSSSSLKITAGVGANLDSLLGTDSSPIGGGSYVRVESLTLYNPNAATLVNGAANIQKLFDGSVFFNLSVANYTGKGLYIHNNGGPIDFYATTVNGNHTSTSPPLVIGNTSENTGDITFFGLSAGHPGPGVNIIQVPSNSTFTQNISIYGLYMEPNSSDTTTPLIDLKGAGPFTIIGLRTGQTAGGSTAYAIQLESGGDMRCVNFQGINPQNGNAVNDLIRSVTVSSGGFNSSSYSWSTGQDIKTLSGLTVNNNADSTAVTVLRSGATADQATSLVWQDHSGNSKWNWQKLSDNRLQLLDGGTFRQLFNIGGNTQYNVATSQNHIFQVNGTTTAQIGSGIVINNVAAPTVSANQLGIGSTTATSATAGANGAVPAQVVGYLIVNIGGTNFKIPYFNT